MKTRWSRWLVGLAGAIATAGSVSSPAYGADAAPAPAGAAAASTGAKAQLPEPQRGAAEQLTRMTDTLAGLKSFSVVFRDGYDVVQASGQKIEFGETRTVTVVRPNLMRVEEVSSDGLRDLALFGGHEISVLDADANVYAQVPQPGTLDESLVYFVRELRMRMPLALLFSTQLPEALAGRVKTIDYVESTDIVGVPTHHIAGRTDNVDFQFWVAATGKPLPVRVVITYVQSPGEPQFWATFARWNETPKIAADTFKFTPPAGARKIAFAVQVRPGAPGQSPAASGEVQP
ncbi:MAG TPA: DUF2092 domain-containing protein [Steroidobacteraceae bacterium]|nr:DUF2092 domain-containing protein [Steroidobacteraceae bacterium]